MSNPKTRSGGNRGRSVSPSAATRNGRSKSVHRRTVKEEEENHDYNSRQRGKSRGRSNASCSPSRRRSKSVLHRDHHITSNRRGSRSEDDFDSHRHRSRSKSVHRRRDDIFDSESEYSEEEEHQPTSRHQRGRVTRTNSRAARGGKPTLSKELQRRRSERRLQVEEIKNKERIQNQMIDQALFRCRSSRGLNMNLSDYGEDREEHVSRRAGRGSNQLNSDESDKSRRGSRRTSDDNGGGSSMKRSSSRRGLKLSSDDRGEEHIRRNAKSSHRRASSSRRLALNADDETKPKRTSSSRRLILDADEEGKSRRRTALKRSTSFDSTTPAVLKRTMSRGGGQSEDESIYRVSRGNGRSSRDCGVKKGGSTRRRKTDNDMIDESAPDFLSSSEEEVEEEAQLSSGHTRRFEAASQKNRPQKASDELDGQEGFFGQWEDDDFFGGAGGAKAGAIKDEAEREETVEAIEALAKAGKTKRVPNKTFMAVTNAIENADPKSAVLKKAAHGRALTQRAKSERKYTLEDLSEQHSCATATSRSSGRNSSLTDGPPSNVRPGLYDNKSNQTSLALLKLGKEMDVSSCSRSQQTRSTVGTNASSSTHSSLSRSVSSHSSAESQTQKMKDFGSRFRSIKSDQQVVSRPERDTSLL